MLRKVSNAPENVSNGIEKVSNAIKNVSNDFEKVSNERGKGYRPFLRHCFSS